MKKSLKKVKCTEDSICTAFITAFMYKFPKYSHLITLFPADGVRDKRTGAKLKKLGLARGWPDYQFMLTNKRFSGMFLEFKTEKGIVSKHQNERMGQLTDAGYYCCVVRSVNEALDEIKSYIDDK